MSKDLDTLIAKHSGLVYSQLHKFYLINDPEAESIAFEALWKAIVNYDSSKGTQLSTVASVYIYNALGSYIRTLNNKRQLDVISYNNQISPDDKNEFLDYIVSAPSVEDDYIKEETSRNVMRTFKNLYDNLTNERHKEIIEVWQGNDFDITTKDIANIVGVSQSYVSQVINIFRHNLKKKMEEN